jgi:hypothetical protein
LTSVDQLTERERICGLQRDRLNGRCSERCRAGCQSDA